MYFSEQKLVIEIDEKGNTDRNQNKENESVLIANSIGLILM